MDLDTHLTAVTPLNTEKWKQIEINDMLLNYDVSSHGRVRHHVTLHVKPQYETRSGYKIVALYRPGDRRPWMITVGRLVANAFLRLRCPGEQVEHKDQNRTNNFAKNLMITDQSTNIRRSYKLSQRRRGGGSRFLTESSYELVKSLWRSGKYSQVRIGRMVGLCNSTVSKIVNGKCQPRESGHLELTVDWTKSK